LALLLALTLALAGCSGAAGTESSAPTGSAGQSSEPVGDTATASNTGAFTTSYEYIEDDMNAAWDKGQATSITFNGVSAEVSGNGAVFADGTLTISQAGTYALTGTLTDGQVLIDAGNDDVVRLVLNGVSISNSSGSAIYAPQSEKAVLILEAGTKNTVTDGANYAATNDENEPDAAIFAQDDLSITGSGTLTVTGNYAHGIRAQDILAVTGGTLNITAVGDTLRGRDGVAVKDGSFTLNAGGDGIQSNNADEDAQGFVVIDGGSYSIQSANDGIQAASSLTVTGGTLQITTGGGSANAPVREAEFGEMPGGNWSGQSAPATSAPETTAATTAPETAEEAPAAATTEDESVSMKALKAGKQLTVTGGDVTVDSEDDALHSNGTVTVTAGTISIEAGNDGMHADTSLEISGGAIDIPTSYEGIEGLSVTISGGDIKVVASDDGINAADGESGGPGAMQGGRQTGMPDGMDMDAMREAMEIIRAAGTEELTEEQLQQLHDLGLTDEQIEQFKNMPQGGGRGDMSGEQMPGGMPQGGEGGMTEPKFAVTEGAFIRITGGTLDIMGGADGIDSNGHIQLEGGTVTVNGSSMGAEGALEMEGDFTITGGEFIAAGSVYTPAADSTQPTILLSYTSEQPSGSTVTVKDSSGNTVLEYASKTAFSASGFTSAAFKIGETYSVFIDGEKRTDITLSEQTTSMGDDGGAYTLIGGRGGRGGGQFPDGMAPPEGWNQDGSQPSGASSTPGSGE
jgi:hypothetical protein